MNSTKIRLTAKVAVALALILVCDVVFAADTKAPGDMVAVVNGTIITQGEFDRELDFYVRRATQGGQQTPEFQKAKIRTDVLESLIERELLYQETQKQGIKIKTDAIAQQLKSLKQRYPTEAEFNKLLSDMGLKESDVENQIKRGMAIQELIDKEVTPKVVITDQESKTYYDTNPQFFQQPEQVKASHILIKVDADATEAQKTEAREKIKEVQQKVQKGEDFASLAKTYSEGPSGPRGGDLGYFRRGQMVKPFEDAAFSLKPNETSDIVETRFGYHLIMVVDKKPERTMAYAEVKDRLNARLKQQKMESEANIYIDNLKKNAKIEKFL
jgi:peptidyl-prolyl cis-trans isomerase C